jgi:SAM-dependent methyltransferase
MDNTLTRWLQLREPADTAARSSTLTAALLPALTATAAAGPLRVLDLGTGTGANVRYLAPRLPGRQQWLAVDRNPALLAQLPARLSLLTAAHGGEPPHCDIATRVVDLDTLDDDSLFAGRHLVTASALLDLASESWLTTLAARCRAVGAAVLFALSYDGSSTCWPAEPEDDMVRGLLNRHQRRDKGLGGPAAGPDAAAWAVRCLADAGYHVRAEPSRWILGSSEHELQQELVDGWHRAAIEVIPDAAGTIARWHTRRRAHIDGNRSQIVVGHVDIAAWAVG